MKNLRMNFACGVIAFAIKLLPVDWRTGKAVKNLISTGAIRVN